MTHPRAVGALGGDHQQQALASGEELDLDAELTGERLDALVNMRTVRARPRRRRAIRSRTWPVASRRDGVISGIDIVNLQHFGGGLAAGAAGFGVGDQIDAVARQGAAQRRQPAVLGQAVGKAGLEHMHGDGRGRRSAGRGA